MKKIIAIVTLASLCVSSSFSQTSKITVTDSNTPLHALQPDYTVPYGPAKSEDVKSTIDKIYKFLDEVTPARVVNGKTNVEVKKLNANVAFEQGVFRLISYEWGVTYGAMLLASEVTGEEKYKDYTTTRMNLIASVADYFRSLSDDQIDNSPVKSVLRPSVLDDAGSLCAASLKTYNVNKNPSLRVMADNYIDFIVNKQYRLEDGTFSRNRPFPNTMWLDDLYMSVPALAQMAKLTGDYKYYDEACGQVLRFASRMFNEDKGLFMHGWAQDMDTHPAFYWGRCNGWAMLTMVELLEVLPENHSAREEILNLYKAHVEGVTALQSKAGLWHQLLNKEDSYLETSATAIFTYCIAHGVNKGWLNAAAYGPVAVLGWNAVQTKVNDEGQIDGTCVGTGMAFDPAFYYHRPVNVAAAHGYGPTLLAGAEMIRLLDSFEIAINDSAVTFYKKGTDWRQGK